MAETVARPRAILIALDFSKPGEAAFQAGLHLAQDLGVGVLLFHVFRPRFIAAEEVGWNPALVADSEAQEEEEEAVDLTTRWAEEARAEGLAVSTETARGDPASLILEAARRHHALVTVLGTHGRTGLGRFVMGSVAEAVVRRSDRPVLVVPAAA